MQSEYDELTDELRNIVSHTAFGGTNLLNTSSTEGGSLGKPAGLVFEIGADSSETMQVGFSTDLTHINSALQQATTSNVARPDINGNTFVTIVSRFAGDSSALDTTPGHALVNAVIFTIGHVPDGRQ